MYFRLKKSENQSLQPLFVRGHYCLFLCLKGLDGQPGDPGRAGEIGFDVSILQLFPPLKIN